MTARPLLLACLVVLAGCATPFGPSTPTESTPAPTPEPTTGTAGPGPTTDAGEPTTAPEAAHWWRDTVVVAVRNEGRGDRAFAPLVRQAAAFWEANEQYLAAPVRYEVRPDAEDPDVVVTFTDHVPDCGDVRDAAGCAPLLTDRPTVDRPVTVWVKTGLRDESTVRVTKHELGHTLGLTHDDPPEAVMRARSVLYAEPQPNATERAFPWDDADFTVRVDAANASDPARVRTQTDRALTYYEDGPPGVPGNLTFERVDAGDAEIAVVFGPTAGCSESSGSCVTTYGTDPDGDGAIETYTRVEIRLVGVDGDAVGWHVGYWLAHAFGAEADAEKPPPFRDASYRERRSAWWE